MANVNTAAGAPSLIVAAVHYLNVVSGGTLSAAPGAPNRFVVPESTSTPQCSWPIACLLLCMERHTLHASKI